MYISKKIRRIGFGLFVAINISLIATALVIAFLSSRTPEIEKNTEILSVKMDTTKFETSIYGFDITKAAESIEDEGSYKLGMGYELNAFKTSKYFEICYNKGKRSNHSFVANMLESMEKERARLIKFFGMKDDDVPVIKIYVFDGANDMVAERKQALGGRDLSQSFGNINSIYLTNRDDGIHQLRECVLASFAGEKPQPMWLQNGYLHYLSGSEDDNNLSYIKMSRDNKISFETIAANSNLASMYSSSLAKAIVSEYGESGLVKLLSTYGDVGEALNITTAELTAAWREYALENAPKTAYALNIEDYKAAIDKDGVYTDKYGYNYDAYEESEHFIVVFFDYKNTRDFVKDALNLFEEAYKPAIEAFGLTEEDIPKIKVFLCWGDYEIYSYMPDGVLMNDYSTAMVTAPNHLIFYRNEKGIYSQWDEIIKQEVVHCAYLEKMNRLYPDYFSDSPWLVEGLAQFYSRKSDAFYRLYPSMIQNPLPLAEDGTQPYFAAYEENHAYGYTLIEYILSLGKENVIEQLMKNPEKLQEITGMSMAEFEAGWKAFVAAKITDKEKKE